MGLVVDQFLRSQAGEGRGIAGVDGSGLAARGATGRASVGALGASTAAGSVAASATESTLESASAGGSVSTATAATEASTGAATARLGSLDEALVDVEDLLLLALTLALGLAAGASNEVLLFFLGDRLSVGPLLVLLAALVGLAGLRDPGTELELLLGQLGEVIGVGDAVVLGLSLGLGLGGCSLALLLVSLSNGITGLLILQLGIALVGAPAVASLLLGVTVAVRRGTWKDGVKSYPPTVRL